MPHRTDVLNRIFKRIIGDETATQYYLRHTFATKCQEYVRPDIVDIWMDIAPEGLSDGFIRTFPTSLCKSKWTRLFSIFKRYLFPKTFPKRANLCNFLFIFYAKQAQKKQITEFLFDNLHKWCGRQELNLHGVSHKILSLARLPVPPRPRITGLLYNNRRGLSTYFYLLLKVFFIFSCCRGIFFSYLFQTKKLRIFFLIHTHNMCKRRKFL